MINLRPLLIALTLVLSIAQTSLGQDGLPTAGGTSRFTNNTASITLPAKFVGDHIFVETYIEGRGPYYFGLDTGASYSIMWPDLAQSLRLKSQKLKGKVKLPYV